MPSTSTVRPLAHRSRLRGARSSSQCTWAKRSAGRFCISAKSTSSGLTAAASRLIAGHRRQRAIGQCGFKARQRTPAKCTDWHYPPRTAW